jgi:DNA-binding HxlR family transcriptional regulator
MDFKASGAVEGGTCPVRALLDRMGDRWSMLVLLTLREAGTLRFSALKAQMLDVSQRMLARTLRLLERDGLVSRTVHAGVAPPRVDYALTTLGISFLVPFMGLVEWSVRHQDDLRVARAAYEEIGRAVWFPLPPGEG